MLRRIQLVLTVIVLQGACGIARATPSLMEELPASSRFRCLNCHTNQDPVVANAELNPFGNAFKDNASRWDEKLARAGADGDNCTNGFELGDENGDGRIEDTRHPEERHNPGEPDCSLQLKDETWQALKQLFR